VPAIKLLLIQPVQGNPPITANKNSFTPTTNHHNFLKAHGSSLSIYGHLISPLHDLTLQDGGGLSEHSNPLIHAADDVPPKRAI